MNSFTAKYLLFPMTAQCYAIQLNNDENLGKYSIALKSSPNMPRLLKDRYFSQNGKIFESHMFQSNSIVY